VIIFDSSFLVVLMHPNCPPAKDRNNNPVSQFKERVAHLAATMDVSNEVIGVPAPAMAEVLVRAGAGRSQYVSVLSDTWKFQILPFDSRAAIESSELIAKVKTAKESWGTWAKVKFDIQIVAIARAESATLIYADDKDIENLAKRLKIKVCRICDLPIPVVPTEVTVEAGPAGSQGLLNLHLEKKLDEPLAKPPASSTETGREENDKLKTDPPHPPAI
jgi:predicted nucleic acid-binding protein